MAEITLTQVPWPAGTAVGAYPRRSEWMSPDGPPPGVPAAATQPVQANRSLAYTLPDGEYWAAAPIGWKWQYVSFLAEVPPLSEDEAIDDLNERIDALEASDVGDEARLDAIEAGNADARLDTIEPALNAVKDKVDVWIDVTEPDGPVPGATGDGSTDDTDAILHKYEQMVGTANPASNTRAGLKALWFPKGDYRITRTLALLSSQRIKIVFEGGARILVDGAMQSAMHFDGISRSTVEGIWIEGHSSGNGVCDYGICVSWTTAASRSTTKTRFVSCHVENLKCKYGIAVEPFNSSRQNDPVSFQNCIASGLISSQPGYDPAYYLSGFLVGSGANGNTYNNYFDKCSAVRWTSGLKLNGGNGHWWGGEMVDCDTMISGQAYRTLLLGGGLRAEGCGRIYDGSGASTVTQTIDIGNMWFNLNALRTNGEVVDFGGAGTLWVHDIVFHGVIPGGSANPSVRVSDNAANVIERLTMPTAPSAVIVGTSSSRVRLSDHNETNPSTGGLVQRYPGDIYAYSNLKTAMPSGTVYKDSVGAVLMRKGSAADAARRVDGPQLRNGQLGFFSPTAPYTRPADLALAAGLMIAARAVFDEEFATISASFVVTVAAGSADQVDLVVFTKSGISSGTPRARSGVVTPTGGALNSTGKKTVTWIAPLIALVPTVYYVGILCPTVGSTPASIQGADFGSAAAVQMFGTTHPIPEVVQKPGLADTSVLSNAGFTLPSNGLGPAIWLNE